MHMSLCNYSVDFEHLCVSLYFIHQLIILHLLIGIARKKYNDMHPHMHFNTNYFRYTIPRSV